jgi:hypothetical protein
MPLDDRAVGRDQDRAADAEPIDARAQAGRLRGIATTHLPRGRLQARGRHHHGLQKRREIVAAVLGRVNADLRQRALNVIVFDFFPVPSVREFRGKSLIYKTVLSLFLGACLKIRGFPCFFPDTREVRVLGLHTVDVFVVFVLPALRLGRQVGHFRAIE